MLLKYLIAAHLFFLTGFFSTASAAELITINSNDAKSELAISEQNKQLSRIADQLQKLIPDPVEEAAKTEREKQDLSAQKNMAIWAKAMFWITALGSIAAVFSIAFLYFTLKQNTTSLTLANEELALSKQSAEIQFRSYIGLSIHDSYSNLFNLKPYPFVQVKIKNHGATPARKMSIAVGTVWKNFDTPEDYEYEHLGATLYPSLVLMPGSETSITHTYREDQNFYLRRLIGRESKLFVDAHVAYEDFFGNQHKSTLRFIIQATPQAEILGYISDFGNSVS